MNHHESAISDGGRFLRQAWPPEVSEFGAAEHQVLWHGLLPALHEPSLQVLQDFIDPRVVGKSIAGGQENGHYCSRRLRLGEWSKIVQQRRLIAYATGFDNQGNLLPTVSPNSRDSFLRQRAEAAREMQEPLPADETAPDPTWPVGTRFWFKLDMTDHENCAPYLNPELTERFYDAKTFERFVNPILNAIDREMPGQKPQTARIRADLRWWVEHDARHVPGIDDSWDI